jgi:penicillin-binding protein 1A
LAGFLLLMVAAVVGVVLLIPILRDLPDIDLLRSFQPSIVTTVYDDRDEPIGEFFVERRVLVALEEVPLELLQALQAVEDVRFREHPGFDPIGIARALVNNLRAGRVVEGASTITQQLTRNLFLSSERSYQRKIREQYLAYTIERTFTKEEILRMYVNQIYFGHGAYGVEAAARTFFGCSVSGLSLHQCALLAALPKSPTHYSPLRRPEAALRRRNLVLERMVAAGFLGEEEAATAAARDLDLSPRQAHQFAPHFIEQVRRELYARHDMALYREGLNVYTTLDRAMQEAAELAVQEGLHELMARRGIDPKAVEHPEAALIAIEAGTGHIKALVGGYSFAESEFNRAYQAQRQVGSTVKPFVYAAALLQGYTPASVILDAPVTFFPDKPWRWRPQNFERRFHGPTRLREALAKSRNVVTARLAAEIGIESVVDLARQMGVDSPLRPYLALALGAGEVTLREMTGAYSVFLNDGIYIRPTWLRRVTDRRGLVLDASAPETRQALDPAVAGIMRSMLREVVESGTARQAKKLPFPVCGKTGTTNGYTDAWFVGFSPRLVAGVWVGYDLKVPLGNRETGSRAALPIWLQFMAAAHEGTSELSFPPPHGVESALICPRSGLLAGPACPKPREEFFLPGTVPVELCGIH